MNGKNILRYVGESEKRKSAAVMNITPPSSFKVMYTYRQILESIISFANNNRITNKKN